MFKTKATVTVKDNQGKVLITQDYDKVVFGGTQIDAKGNAVGPFGDDGTTRADNADEQLVQAAISFYISEAGPSGNGVADMLADLTYAYDLGRRASIRQQLVTAAAGPDKAIEKAIKDLMAARAAAGKPIDEVTARAKVKALMED